MNPPERSLVSKRAYHHGQLRQALVAAALDLIRSEGPQGFTLREVARRAGVSHTAPYRHFADKNALLAFVAEEGFRHLAAFMQVRADAGRTPLARLHAIGIAYVLFARENPAHFRVMFSAEIEDKSAYPELAEAGHAAYQLLLAQVEACRTAGVLKLGGTEELSLAAWSLVHGLAMLMIDGQLRCAEGMPDEAALAERVVTLFYAGLAEAR